MTTLGENCYHHPPDNARSLSKLGRAAYAYSSRLCWPVIPLVPKSKVPKPGSRGVHDATQATGKILRWWTETPEANIGIACGHQSGFWALDLDPRNGGEFTFDDLVADHGPLPETVIQETGGGGLHYLFSWPTDGRVPRRSPGPGLDVKGAGGYILGAPSIHPNGGEYCWQELSHPLQIPVKDAPDWLLNLVCERRGSQLGGRSTDEWAHLLGPAQQGQHHERLLSVAGYLFRRMPAVIAFELATAWAKARLDPQLEEDDVRSLLNRVARLECSRIGGKE